MRIVVFLTRNAEVSLKQRTALIKLAHALQKQRSLASKERFSMAVTIEVTVRLY